jgi:hypothetical protein
MKRLLLVIACLAVLGPVLADGVKKPAVDKAKQKKCTLENCGCDLDSKELVENEDLLKKTRACWSVLAKYNVLDKTEEAHLKCLDQAYADARKSGKIVLYFGNTGG